MRRLSLRPAAIVFLMAAGVGALSCAAFVINIEVPSITQRISSSSVTPATTTDREPQQSPTGQPQDSRGQRPAVPRPAWVRIPRLDVQAVVRPSGVTGEGIAKIPNDGDEIGWYRYGPRPGQRGSAVLIGHRDTTAEGPGVLFAIDLLQRGDRIIVESTKGTMAFAVTTSTYYDKQALPATVFARDGPAHLTLITCGGAFDATRGGYQQNYVVVAEPVTSSGR